MRDQVPGARGQGSRLQPDMVVLYDGQECRVVLVNDCRAVIVPVAKRLKVIAPQTGTNAGIVRRFYVERAGHNVSPNSELEEVVA